MSESTLQLEHSPAYLVAQCGVSFLVVDDFAATKYVATTGTRGCGGYTVRVAGMGAAGSEHFYILRFGKQVLNFVGSCRR